MTTHADDDGLWLRHDFLPHWHRRSSHPAGGFVDAVHPMAGIDLNAPRSLLVQARLAYSFAAAADERSGSLLKIALDTMDLIDHAFAAPNGGYVKAIDAAGRPSDPTRDFYDMTFVVLASAWLYRRTGDPRHVARLDQVLQFFDDAMAHPAGGWRETAEPSSLPRRQNPHMHLLEALLAAFDATGDSAYRWRADRIVDLLLSKFLDRNTQTLIEYFDENLGPAPGPSGSWREPGHHFEWTWLLIEHYRLTGERYALAAATSLYRTGMRHGFVQTDHGPQVIEAMDSTGRCLSADRLLWPQTEYVKAEAAMGFLTGDHEAVGRGRHHLKRSRAARFEPDGVTWRNRITTSGGVLADATIPIRVIYHIVFCVLALEERAPSGTASIEAMSRR